MDRREVDMSAAPRREQFAHFRAMDHPLRHLFVSALPWLPYTQIKAPAPGRDESNPRIFWGRYTRREGRWELPVSLFVNHALADGVHLARFYQALEGELAALSAQFQQENK